MSKRFKIVIALTIVFLACYLIPVFAETYEDLDTLDITLDKAVVNPDDEVTVNINFGKDLGSYDISLDFDDALFDYVETGTGTASVSDDTVTVSFFDAQNARSTETVKFRAKSGITSSNPSQFLVTLTGMANADETIIYNDTTPNVKDILVEPKYSNYDITVSYAEPLVKDKENDIDVKISSSLGRNYDHLRLLAEVTEPDGANMQLLGTDNAQLEHNVIQNGWGDAAGFGLGGTVNETYNFRGVFSKDR